MTQYAIYKSPIGDITITTDGTSLTGLHIEGDRHFTSIPDSWIHVQDNPLLQKVQTELDEYFNGSRTAFTVPINTAGTDFQQLVWSALQNIPAGVNISYGELARQIDRPKAVRAVGTAIGRNPICIIVPCHRVLASDGSLGGYVAGIERKKYLLDLERRQATI